MGNLELLFEDPYEWIPLIGMCFAGKNIFEGTLNAYKNPLRFYATSWFQTFCVGATIATIYLTA
jgi:hypothetical protein